MEQYSVINDGEMAKLKEAGIKETHLKSYVTYFCAKKEVWKTPFNKVNLMFFIDSYGDFMSRDSKACRIAQAIFHSLDSKDRQDVVRYLLEFDALENRK